MMASALGVCLASAGVTGDGKEGAATLAFVESTFSWELEGSMASLLGTGVTVDLPGFARKLSLVDSLRHVGEASAPLEADGVGVFFAADAGLPKKPKILCCFPVDAEPPVFFCVDGVLAGVFAVLGVDIVAALVRVPISEVRRIEVKRAKHSVNGGWQGLHKVVWAASVLGESRDGI